MKNIFIRGKNANGKLDKIYEGLCRLGEFTDDLSLLRIELKI